MAAIAESIIKAPHYVVSNQEIFFSLLRDQVGTQLEHFRQRLILLRSEMRTMRTVAGSLTIVEQEKFVRCQNVLRERILVIAQSIRAFHNSNNITGFYLRDVGVVNYITVDGIALRTGTWYAMTEQQLNEHKAELERLLNDVADGQNGH